MISTILSIISFIMLVSVIPIMVLTFRGRFQFMQGVLLSAGAMVLSFVASVSSFNKQTGQNIINLVIKESFDQIKQTFQALPIQQLQKMLGNVTVEQAQAYQRDLSNALGSYMEIYTLLIPAVMILSMLSISFGAFMLVKVVLGLFKFDVSKFPMFSEFKASKSIIIALCVSLIGAFSFTIDTISAAFLNIAVVIIGVMVICGFSLLDFKIREKVDNSWVRLLIHLPIIILGLFSPLLAYLCIFASIFDAFFDFRKLSKKGSEEDENGE